MVSLYEGQENAGLGLFLFFLNLSNDFFSFIQFRLVLFFSPLPEHRTFLYSFTPIRYFFFFRFIINILHTIVFTHTKWINIHAQTHTYQLYVKHQMRNTINVQNMNNPFRCECFPIFFFANVLKCVFFVWARWCKNEWPENNR